MVYTGGEDLSSFGLSNSGLNVWWLDGARNCNSFGILYGEKKSMTLNLLKKGQDRGFCLDEMQDIKWLY